MLLMCLLGWTAVVEIRLGTQPHWWQWLDLWHVVSLVFGGGRILGGTAVAACLCITIGVSTTYLVYTDHPHTTALKSAIGLCFSVLL